MQITTQQVSFRIIFNIGVHLGFLENVVKSQLLVQMCYSRVKRMPILPFKKVHSAQLSYPASFSGHDVFIIILPLKVDIF